jgi:hypothetical protein
MLATHVLFDSRGRSLVHGFAATLLSFSHVPATWDTRDEPVAVEPARLTPGQHVRITDPTHPAFGRVATVDQVSESGRTGLAFDATGVGGIIGAGECEPAEPLPFEPIIADDSEACPHGDPDCDQPDDACHDGCYTDEDRRRFAADPDYDPTAPKCSRCNGPLRPDMVDSGECGLCELGDPDDDGPITGSPRFGLGFSDAPANLVDDATEADDLADLDVESPVAAQRYAYRVGLAATSVFIEDDAEVGRLYAQSYAIAADGYSVPMPSGLGRRGIEGWARGKSMGESARWSAWYSAGLKAGLTEDEEAVIPGGARDDDATSGWAAGLKAAADIWAARADAWIDELRDNHESMEEYARLVGAY